MKVNVGKGDQAIRLIAGIALLSVIVAGTSEWRWLGLIGLIPFATGATRICPLYTLAGINTCDKETQHVQEHPGAD